MLWGCFPAGGTGAFHKINVITKKENDVDILKQHLKTSQDKLRLGRNDPKHTSKVVEKWLRPTKSRYWSGYHNALTSIL